MKPKAVIKLSIDAVMTLAMLFLMGYHFWGETLHEWVGAGMLLLFIVHHILNGHWYKNLFKGKYNVLRILTLCIDSFVLVSMLTQMYSGIVISRHVFDFLPAIGGISFARQLHILGAYWGFLLINIHLGIHWNMILKISRKKAEIKSKTKKRSFIAFIVGLLIAGYGIWVFIDRDFFTYMFLKSKFVFLDYSESKISFYIDYLALMGLYIFIAHYSTKLLQKFKKKTERS